MDEREAVSRMRDGDIGGLEPLVRAYQQRAVRAAYLVTRDLAQAEDIVQSAFIRAFERIEQLRSADAFGPWFLRSVVNDASKAVARAARHTALEPGAVVGTAWMSDPEPGPEELVAGVETREELWSALAALTPEQRAAVVLHYYIGLTGSEVSTRTGAHPGTVRWRLHAARRRLREILRVDPRDEPSRATNERSQR